MDVGQFGAVEGVLRRPDRPRLPLRARDQNLRLRREDAVLGVQRDVPDELALIVEEVDLEGVVR